MLKLQISKNAEKFLRDLPTKQKKQLVSKIIALKKYGHTFDSKHRKGSSWYRVDTGEYRIIYDIENKNTLTIFLIGKKNDDDIYRKLSRL